MKVGNKEDVPDPDKEREKSTREKITMLYKNEKKRQDKENEKKEASKRMKFEKPNDAIATVGKGLAQIRIVGGGDDITTLKVKG